MPNSARGVLGTLVDKAEAHVDSEDDPAFTSSSATQLTSTSTASGEASEPELDSTDCCAPGVCGQVDRKGMELLVGEVLRVEKPVDVMLVVRIGLACSNEEGVAQKDSA